MAKRGIIIANTGTPDAPAPEAVRAYLQEFLTDPRICPMNPILWHFILNAFILPRRSQASAEKYQQIWTEEGSPLSVIMASLATKLEAALNVTRPDGEPILVRHAMSYGSPSMKTVLLELNELGCDDLCVIPLYPQSAFSTAKVVEDKLHAGLRQLEWDPQLTFVDNYHGHETYLDAIAASIRGAGFTSNDSLLMVFHSIPMKDVTAGDTYPDQVDATARAIAERLGLAEDQWRVGFQSRFDSRRWVGPFTKGVLDELATNPGRLFVVAPNFSIDCLETIYDIETELKAAYATLKGSRADEDPQDFVYVRCLNDSDSHVRLLAQVAQG